MLAQKITTSVSYEQYMEMKRNHWKPSELITLGIAAKVKPDVLQEQIIGMKNQIAALEIKLKRENTRRLMSWGARKDE